MTPQAGAPQPWEIGEVLGRAWEIYKANWGVLTGAVVVFYICVFVPQYGISMGIVLSGNGPGTSGYWPAFGGNNIITMLIESFFFVGLNRIFIAAARGETPQFATLFSGGSRMLPFFGTLLLMYIAIVIGFLCLVVPGVILMLGLGPALLFVSDTDLGVVDSLKASWEAMKGHKGNYFLFMLVGFCLMLAGALACCVGELVAFPLFLVAQAIIYTRISGRMGTPAAAAVGYGGPPPGYGGPPPGYGGPPGGPPPAGGGYGGPPPGAPPGGYGPPPGGGGYGPPGGGGGYGPPPGGGGFPPR
jgi:uncharacterized membrane protein